MIPSGPISLTMGVATLIAVLLSIRSNPQCSIALFISLIGARVVTHYGVSDIHSIIMFASFMICIVNFSWFKISLIEIDKNEVNYLVAILYIPRMLVVFIASLGVISSSAMWLASIAFLIIQVALVIGDSIGYSNHINSAIHRGRIGLHGLVFASGRHDQR